MSKKGSDKNQEVNPSQMFQEWVTNWERGFDTLANQVMGTEGFSQTMNEAQKAQLAMQKALASIASQNLRTFNMPSRDDVLRLSEALSQISLRLERIEEKLDLTEPAIAAEPRQRPPRTKKPPVDADKGSKA